MYTIVLMLKESLVKKYFVFCYFFFNLFLFGNEIKIVDLKPKIIDYFTNNFHFYLKDNLNNFTYGYYRFYLNRNKYYSEDLTNEKYKNIIPLNKINELGKYFIITQTLQFNIIYLNCLGTSFLIPGIILLNNYQFDKSELDNNLAGLGVSLIGGGAGAFIMGIVILALLIVNSLKFYKTKKSILQTLNGKVALIFKNIKISFIIE